MAAPAVAQASAPPAKATSTTSDLDGFASGIARLTGLNANVVKAWALAEGAYAPNGTGHYNFLNVRPSGTGGSYSGVPLAGVSSGNFQEFGSLNDAVTETAHWINSFANYSGLRASAGQSPQAQIAAIAASPWDQARYGGGGGIVSLYNSIVSGSSRLPAGGVSGSASGGGGILGSIEHLPGEAASTVNNGLRHVPGVAQAEGTVSATEQAATSTAKAISWLSDWGNWIRIGYLLGGSVLVLGGVVLLARSVGGSSLPSMPSLPSGTPPPSSQEGDLSKRPPSVELEGDRAERESRKPRRGQPGSGKLAAGDSIPF